MKRIYLITLLSVLFSYVMNAQSKELEYNNLRERYDRGLINTQQFQTEIRNLKWIDELDTIINIPYDPVYKTIEYEYTYDIPGVSKQLLLQRIMEYDAIYYMGTNSLDYVNEQLGRVVLHGQFLYTDNYNFFEGLMMGLFGGKVENYLVTCNYSAVLSVKDEALKIELKNIFMQYSYTFSIDNQYSEYSENVLNNVPLTKYYPLTNLLTQGERKDAHELLLSVSGQLNKQADHISYFLNSTNKEINW